MDANKFVAEGKLEEEHKRRQAEWERVRKPSDPIEAPAEMFDNRTLYDRLKEQHEFKKKQFEDQFALSIINVIVNLYFITKSVVLKRIKYVV